MSRSMLRRDFILTAVTISVVLALGGPALAQRQSTTQKSEGKLVALDPATGTITVEQKGKPVVYQALFEGSVLTRTTATLNAKPVKLGALPVGAKVVVYWWFDENDPELRHARKVDAPDSADELMD